MRDLGFSRKKKGEVTTYTKGDLIIVDDYDYMLKGASWLGVSEEQVIAVLAGAAIMDYDKGQTISLWNRMLGDG